MSAVLPLRKHRLPQFEELRARLRAILSERLAEHFTSFSLHGVDRTDRLPAVAVDGSPTGPSTDFDELIADLELVGNVDRIEGLIATEWPENSETRP